VLIKCHANCPTDAVLDALGLTMADLAPPDPGTEDDWTPAGPAVATYTYTDEDGRLLFGVCRTAGKQFRQWRPDASKRSGRSWSLNGVRRVPYRLPQVRAAAAAGEVVYVVEGEKDVHAVEATGAVATCNAGGAGKWRPEHAEHLAGAHVVVVADRDAPGRAHAAQVAASLHGIAATVRVVEAAAGKDVADHLSAGHTLDQLIGVEAEPAAARPTARTSWTAADLLGADFPEPRWAVPGILAEGLNLLVGAPKLGKSWFAMNVGAAVAGGGRALGKVSLEQGEVLYLALEDPPRRLQQRLRMIIDGGAAPAGLHFEVAWERLTDGGADRLDKWLTAHPDCRLVVVDVLARVRGQVDDRANRYDSDYAAMVALKELADRHAVCVVVLHHARKSLAEDFIDSVSGTHGLAGAADAVLVMRRARNSADALLLVTGRDVEEAERAMRFDATRGAWTLLDGPAADYDMSDERRRILAAVRGAPGLGPKAIADASGVNHATVKQLVRKMLDADQLDTDGNGRYLPVAATVTRLYPDAGGGEER